MSGFQPYLSVVVTARNDDHGGDPLYRMQTFIDSLAEQCARFALSTELIVVEWNPPDDRPRLAEALEWPRGNRHFRVRMIEVPADIHSRLEHADRLPLYQMIAKNVGIRRARGHYVLATNIDVIFDDQLIKELARRRLLPRRLYRADRYDVPGTVDESAPNLMAWARSHVIRLHARRGSVDTRTGEFYSIGEHSWITNWVFTQLARRPRMMLALRRAQARMSETVPMPSQTPRALLRHNATLGERLAYAWSTADAAAADGFVVLRELAATAVEATAAAARFFRDAGWLLRRFLYWLWCGLKEPRLVPRRFTRRLRRLWRAAVATLHAPTPRPRTRGRHPRPEAALGRISRRLGVREAWAARRARLTLHTNACGDFTLMAREDWERTMAYPELQQFSMHIDGLFLYQAHWAGVREHVLPYPIFHLEHGAGFRPDTASVRELETRMERAKIPQITSAQFEEWIRTMRQQRSALPFNDDTWGFGLEALPERDPTAVLEVAS